MGKLNAEWHAENPMPPKATMQQRIAWHLEHQKHCACRPIPDGVLAAMRGPEELMLFSGPSDWRKWLEQNHSSSTGMWMQIAKKGSPQPSASYAEALDEALCFGWIDGQKKPLDESFWLQRFVPRRARSNWSKINREHAERLIKEGKMASRGLAEIEKAKEDGRWDLAYDSQARIEVPDDLREALSKNEAAARFFETLKGPNRYAILYRIQTAKKPEIRVSRIEKFVDMCSRGETVFPQSG